MSISRKRRRARVQKKSHIWNLKKLKRGLNRAAIAAFKVGASMADIEPAFVEAARGLSELTAPPAANGVEK